MMKKLSDHILIIENVLTEEECSFIINEYENSGNWTPTGLYNLSDKKAKANCSHVMITLDKHLYKNGNVIDQLIFNRSSECLKLYREKFPFCVVNKDQGYELLKYENGNYLSKHVDYMNEEKDRILSLSFALNDNYEGGEWSFFDDELSFKISTGAAILFPANFMFPHEIKTVSKNIRYSIVTWFN